MEPQSSRFLPVGQVDAVTQKIRVAGVARGQGAGLKVKWKVLYRIDDGGVGDGQLNEETGVIDKLPAI